jgi:hypothetical protein
MWRTFGRIATIVVPAISFVIGSSWLMAFSNGVQSLNLAWNPMCQILQHMGMVPAFCFDEVVYDRTDVVVANDKFEPGPIGLRQFRDPKTGEEVHLDFWRGMWGGNVSTCVVKVPEAFKNNIVGIGADGLPVNDNYKLQIHYRDSASQVDLALFDLEFAVTPWPTKDWGFKCSAIVRRRRLT